MIISQTEVIQDPQDILPFQRKHSKFDTFQILYALLPLDNSVLQH